jgi:hypothetical protein
MTRSALLNTATKAKQPIVQQTKRTFARGSGTAASGGTKMAVGAMGVGLSGLTYLSWMGHQQRKYATPEM